MNKVIADKWVKALRSGKYKQAVGDLQNEVGYCCLGVLCDLGKKEGVDVPMTSSSALGDERISGDELDDQPAVMEWSGIESSCGKVIVGNITDMLTSLNDSDKYTFDQLADVIEKEWEQL